MSEQDAPKEPQDAQPEEEIVAELVTPETEEKPPAPEEIKQLRAKAAERDQFLGQLQHLAADFSNYQKRVARDRAQWAESGRKEILLAVLPLLDNFKRALETSADANAQEILTGFRLMLDQIKNVLAEKNLREMETVGKPFDPTFHEAVTQETSEEHPDMTVIDEFLKGYMYQETVLRPAKVKVARRPQPSQNGEETGE